MVSKRLYTFLIRLIPVIAILSVANIGFAQDELEPEDYYLYISENWLILHITAEEPLKLENFEFSVSDNGEPYFTELGERFGIVIEQDYQVQPGDCYVFILEGTETNLPPECDQESTSASSTRTVEVSPQDRFWYNDSNERLGVSIFVNNNQVSLSCPSEDTVCPVPPTAPANIPSLSQPLLPSDYTPPPNITAPTVQKVLQSGKGAITHISWSPDDQYIISTHVSGDLCLWEDGQITFEPLHCQDAHDLAVTSLDWQPESTQLRFITTGDDGYIRLWELEAGEDEFTFNAIIEADPTQDDDVQIVDGAWTDDGTRVAIAQSNGLLQVWDVESETPEREYQAQTSGIIKLGWYRNGRYIATIDQSNVIRVFDTESQFLAVTLDDYPAPSSADAVQLVGLDWNQALQNQIAVIGKNGQLRLYNYQVGDACPTANKCDFVALSQNLNTLADVQFSPNGTMIAVTINGGVRVIETQEPYLLVNDYELQDDFGVELTSIAWKNDEKQIAVSDGRGNIHVWNVAQTAAPQRIQQVSRWRATDSGPALDLAWKPDGAGVAVVDTNRNLSVWGTGSLAQHGENVAHRQVPVAVDWNPRQQNLIATSGCGPQATIWEASVNIVGSRADSLVCFTKVAFDPTGEFLLVADQGGNIRVWQWQQTVGSNGTYQDYTVDPMANQVNDIAWSTSGTLFAGVDQNGTLKVYELRGRATVETFVRDATPPLRSLAWSPDDMMIAAGAEDSSVMVWRLDSGTTGSDAQGRSLLHGHSSPVIDVSWSINNDWLVSIGEDNRVIVWDATTGERLAQTRLEAAPNHVSWSPAPDFTGDVFAVTDETGHITLFTFKG